jgi:hypothetical protein
VIFFSNYVSEHKAKLEEIEDMYVSMSAALFELCDLWRYLIGPSTDPCILHQTKILKQIVAADVLSVTGEVRFDHSPENIQQEKNKLEEEYSVKPLKYYTKKYEWGNIDTTIRSVL